ncbi:hypothetical protein EDC01DRAFT_462795 [Geopyxis carbonaria]|nr:hypothetical protein EDC01DRAFT_462795 [Geopyxis carbonaria]
MPAAAKTPFSSKNPATIAKSVGAGGYSASSGLQQGGEVVCPLFNSDGSQCRKKCVGNFAYRSICEHIRRAHPDNWIPKLPASPETFAKMVGLTPRLNAGSYSSSAATPLQQHHNGVVRKPTPAARKSSKLSKLDDEHYIEGMSPPSSANESDPLPSLSVTTSNLQHVGPHANFASRFPPPSSYALYDHDDDEADMDGEHEVDDDVLRHHTETETEDEDYNNVYGVHGPAHAQHYGHGHGLAHHPYMHPHMHAHAAHAAPRRAPRQKSTKRKRQSTLDSTGSSSSGFGSGSRWDELIEAATKRAVVENSPMPLSPPQTAQTLPSICPNTPSGNSTTSSHSHHDAPRIQCAECHSLASVKNSYICTECVSGFCEDCALAAGKRGICGECRVFGAKFKPLKVVIRT